MVLNNRTEASRLHRFLQQNVAAVPGCLDLFWRGFPCYQYSGDRFAKLPSETVKDINTGIGIAQTQIG